MNVGNKVRCVVAFEERTDPICTIPSVGAVYTVLGVRDANLKPPADPDRPHEIQIVPGPTETDKLGWWFGGRHFAPAGLPATIPR